MRSVYIVGHGYEYHEMFTRNGWHSAQTPHSADLIQFTGGEDVTPWLYGERAHRTTGYNFGRDIREIEQFGWALEKGIPMAGICRGGQFLNVMCGGSMWQDVDKHAMHGTHAVKDIATGAVFSATSTHHQMMRPGPGGRVVAVAHPSLSTRKESMIPEDIVDNRDVEVVYYERQNALCFQPHPEFLGQQALADQYFQYISTLLLKE